MCKQETLRGFHFVVPSSSDEAMVSALSERSVEIVKFVDASQIYDTNYQSFVFCARSHVQKDVKSYLSTENYLLTQVLLNETIIDEKIFDVYDLTEHDKAMVLAKMG